MIVTADRCPLKRGVQLKKGVGYKRGIRIRKVISYDYSVNAWSGLHYGVLVVQWLVHVPFTSVTRVRLLLSAVIRLKIPS